MAHLNIQLPGQFSRFFEIIKQIFITIKLLSPNFKGVDVAYDSVGKSTWEGSLASLKKRGMLVLFGNASGPVPPIDPLRLSRGGSVYVTRPTLADYTLTREELEWRMSDLIKAYSTGYLPVNVCAEYPLKDAAAAHNLLESRGTTGKIILTP